MTQKPETGPMGLKPEIGKVGELERLVAQFRGRSKRILDNELDVFLGEAQKLQDAGLLTKSAIATHMWSLFNAVNGIREGLVKLRNDIGDIPGSEE